MSVMPQDDDCLPGATEARVQAEKVSIHASIRILNDRLRALELAEDAEFITETAALEARLAAGEDMGPGLTADEFAEKYLPVS